jgi:hypothetical protein
VLCIEGYTVYVGPRFLCANVTEGQGGGHHTTFSQTETCVTIQVQAFLKSHIFSSKQFTIVHVPDEDGWCY